MSKYIHNIVQYFFHHNVSDEIVSRVHDRLAHSGEDTDIAFREIWTELEEKPMDEASVEDAYQDIKKKVFGIENTKRKLSWLRIAAIWAVPFLCLCGSIYFFTGQGNPYKDIEFVHKFTANGERNLITLPDSSKVWLNGGSSLIYPSRFVSAERNVCLSGEAFFEVVKDKRPFIVDVNQIKLKVLGTTFNVMSYPDNPRIIATLETGKIQVNIENQKKPFILSPNEQIEFDSESGEVSIQKVRAENKSAWRTGTLYFEETKFRQAIQQLERAYNVRIHVLNDKYNEQTIRAHFNSNEKAEDIMAVFKMLIPSLSYEINGNDIFIK